MSTITPLRRLIDLPGFRELEFKSVMHPRMTEYDARDTWPELDALSVELFGLTADAADDTPRPDGWDRIERKSDREQVAAFEACGWDVTDDKRKPLRLVSHFNVQLWLALRGVAGAIPFVPDADPDEGGAALAAEAARFRRNKV